MKFTDFSGLQISEYIPSGKKIKLTTSDDKPVQFQIPRMYMPFGISGFTPEMGATKYNVDFAMKGWDEDDNFVKKFYEFLRNLEYTIIQDVEQQSTAIFGKQMDKEELKKLFNSNIKETPDREPKFRVKVDTNYTDNTIKFPIFDSNGNKVSGCVAEQGLYSRHSGVGVVQLTSVYFLNRRFGLTWRFTQLKVFEPQRLKGFHFQLD